MGDLNKVMARTSQRCPRRSHRRRWCSLRSFNSSNLSSTSKSPGTNLWVSTCNFVFFLPCLHHTGKTGFLGRCCTSPSEAAEARAAQEIVAGFECGLSPTTQNDAKLLVSSSLKPEDSTGGMSPIRQNDATLLTSSSLKPSPGCPSSHHEDAMDDASQNFQESSQASCNVGHVAR